MVRLVMVSNARRGLEDVSSEVIVMARQIGLEGSRTDTLLYIHIYPQACLLSTSHNLLQ